MKHFRTILIIGIIEILIGSITLFFNFASILFSTNTKPPNVLFFVIVAGVVSTLIGVGLLKLRKLAYLLLLYFSSVVLLSKILIILDVMQLSGALETSIPSPIKNGISIAYHAFVLYYLQQKDIRRIFHVG